MCNDAETVASFLPTTYRCIAKCVSMRNVGLDKIKKLKTLISLSNNLEFLCGVPSLQCFF